MKKREDAASFDFSKFSFAPVIELPATYDVYDLSHGQGLAGQPPGADGRASDGRQPNPAKRSSHGIGRYNEKRPGMYPQALFTDSEVRNVHVGIDISAPVGTEVRAVYDGVVFMVGINPTAGDYGGTIITEHHFGSHVLWALHGHLSHESVRHQKTGAKISRGQVIGWLGDEKENGGWPPHLHFQLSWQKPNKCDLPGVVSERDREAALKIYPDPRLVLGPLY